MATLPSDPNGGAPNLPNSGNGNGAPNSQSLPRPRATIIMKSNKGTSNSKIPIGTPAPTPLASPGASARLPAVPASVSGRSGVMRSPAQSQRRPAAQIATDREALVLSASRPSEMVQGLEEAAQRAKASAEREEAKRRSGGKMSQVEALHVDDTGRRWSTRVIMGMAATALIVCGLGGYLLYRTAFPGIDYRTAYEVTHRRMYELARGAEQMPPFIEGEHPTAAALKERLQKNLHEQLDVVLRQAQLDRDAKRNPDPRIVDRRDFLENMLKFTDGWDRPLVVNVEDDATVIFAAAPMAGKEMPAPEHGKVRFGAVAKAAENAP